jgi:translation initiation factor IF-3
LNESIRAPEVRVIGSDGKQLGVLKIREAIDKARKEGLSLVEIAPNATPPVAKIVDFGKFRYQEEKKARKDQKKVKGGEVKEIHFSPFIADGDYVTKLKRIREFLNDRNKVKVVVVFGGRQMGSKPMGYLLLGRINNELGETITIDMQPKFLGRYLTTIISPVFKKPVKAVKAQEEKKEEKEEEKEIKEEKKEKTK